jgi:hypothetical protein
MSLIKAWKMEHAPLLPPREALDRLAYYAYCKEHSVYEPLLKSDPEGLLPSILATSGTISIHQDSHELPCYSYHLIIRNDGYIAKGPGQPHAPPYGDVSGIECAPLKIFDKTDMRIRPIPNPIPFL